jgi:sulfur carrier protein
MTSEEEIMKLTVNGESHEHCGTGTIDALLEELGANKAHTALMVNGDVVPSDSWASTALKENDEIEMLVFVGGG